jgi:hypothetical protein
MQFGSEEGEKVTERTEEKGDQTRRNGRGFELAGACPGGNKSGLGS